MGQVERHAYGTSLGCINRRTFIIGVCAVLSVLCIGQLGQWFLSWSLFNRVMGVDSLPPKACLGLECYEVFTCRGFSQTTSNIREPLTTLSGAIIFPIGLIAAVQGFRFELKVLATYLAILALVYIMCFIGDIVYYESCNAYPSDAIEQALLWPIPFPLRRAAQDRLEKMSFWPKSDVDKITGNFATMTMYLVMEAFVCVCLFYTAVQARFLGLLVERGPLGMGVHYGIGQFDEVLNHEAIQKRKEAKSFFVEDGQLPQWKADAEMPLAYHVQHNYGAFSGEAKTLASGPSRDMDHWEQRNTAVDEEISDARDELAKAQQAFDQARDAVAMEKSMEAKEEFETMEQLRQSELNNEFYQEGRAEDLSLRAADEALAQAEANGMSPQEARLVMARTYQATLSQHHRKMLEMARARSLHEHYRHAEREQHYHEMEETVVHDVQNAELEVQRAQARMKEAEMAKDSLDSEKGRLLRLSGDGQESYPEPQTIAPRAAVMSSLVELDADFPSMPLPPTSTLNYAPQTIVGSGSLSPGSYGTSGTFGATADFGSANFAIPSTLPPSSMSAMPVASMGPGSMSSFPGSMVAAVPLASMGPVTNTLPPGRYV